MRIGTEICVNERKEMTYEHRPGFGEKYPRFYPGAHRNFVDENEAIARSRSGRKGNGNNSPSDGI